MRNVVLGISVKGAAAILWVAVLLCLTFSAGAQPSDSAYVTFRAGVHGKLSGTVDGVPVVSGDSVAVGKTIIFTAVPEAGYTDISWWVNGALLRDTSLKTILPVKIDRAVPLDVVVAFEWRSTSHSVVTFRSGPFGTLMAAVDGVPIEPGDSVGVGKNVVFTAYPYKEGSKVSWMVNGAEITDYIVEYQLPVKIFNGAPLDVVAFFESYEEPPGPLRQPLSGVLTFGPSPVRAGGDVAIFWEGNKDVVGELIVLNNLGSVVAKVGVSGMGRIGAWNTRGAAHGTYMVTGMLKDVDGLKCRVLMLVGVVR
jgi:hypothetical protein